MTYRSPVLSHAERHRDVTTRVVVTGGAGFIGSHVVDALIQRGYEVSVIDDLSMGSRGNLNPGADFHELDITNPDLDQLLEQIRPEVICHHAAQVSVGRSQVAPLHDLNVNVAGSLRLLDFARRSGCRFVHASSAAVYGEPKNVPANENEPTHPVNNYGVSKLAFEHYLAAYAATYGIRYVVFRYANVYGPRQNASGEAGVVAVFCEAAARGAPVVIDGDGGQTRDFVFVQDVAEANAIAVASHATGIFNISTGIETDVNRLFETIARAFGKAVASTRGPVRPGDIRRSVLDPGRAVHGLGWRAKVDLETGIAPTARYFMSHKSSETS